MKEKNIDSFLYNNGARTLFLLALLCAVFFTWYIATKIPLEDTRLVQTMPISFDTGWSVVTESGEIPLAEVSRPAANCLTGTMRLVNTLPKTLPANMSLCFQTKNESVRIFVDGKLIYHYGETPQLIFDNGVGAIWNLAELADNAAGKAIAVELTPVDTRTGLAPYEFVLGQHDTVVTALFREKLDLIIISLLLFIIGLVSLGITVFGALRHNKSAEAIFCFSLFTLFSAVWTITDSGLMQFIFANKGVTYMLFGSSFYLLCVPFVLLIASFEAEHKKLFRALAGVTAFYALLRIILFITGNLNFEAGLWLLHLIMAAMIFIINITIWWTLLKKKDYDQIEICLAVSAYSVIAGISLLSFYLNDKLDMLRNGYSSGFYWGIMLFVLITIIGAARRMMHLRQQAFKADFLERRAYTDDLTGLLNVKGFDDKCTEYLKTMPTDVCCALVDFDVNFFSQYNASFGLDAGDQLLKNIAAILRENCDSNELCARQEADHFICMLHGNYLDDIIERIRNINNRNQLPLAERKLLVSYGVVAVMNRSVKPEALRNQAVVAKRTVKGNYENNIAVYDFALHEAQLREMELLTGLEAALEQNEYIIFLQPKICTATEEIGGAEALVRHIAADGTMTSAGPIIEALERKGFVAKLDYYILEKLCQYLRRCLDTGRRVQTVSTNFSRVHLYELDFPQRLADTVDKYAIPHELIEIEVTETAFLAGKEALQSAVFDLHKHGFRVAIDDFGSGYSSLNMLKDVAVDTVKLDREFLEDCVENDRAKKVITHALRLAQEMNITTVAEGVETKAQLDFLRELNCDLIQGYYYSKPLPEADFSARYFTKE